MEDWRNYSYPNYHPVGLNAHHLESFRGENETEAQAARRITNQIAAGIIPTDRQSNGLPLFAAEVTEAESGPVHAKWIVGGLLVLGAWWLSRKG